MSKKDEEGFERAAIVVLRADGRWEVQVSETEGTDGSRRWRHKRMFATEQEAELYARSLLPFVESAWNPRARRGGAEMPPYVSRRDRCRKPKHRSQYESEVDENRQ